LRTLLKGVLTAYPPSPPAASQHGVGAGLICQSAPFRARYKDATRPPPLFPTTLSLPFPPHLFTFLQCPPSFARQAAPSSTLLPTLLLPPFPPCFPKRRLKSISSIHQWEFGNYLLVIAVQDVSRRIIGPENHSPKLRSCRF